MTRNGWTGRRRKRRCSRRADAERIAILFGACEGEARRIEVAGVPELERTGLVETSSAVLASLARSLALTMQDLLAEADGFC